jgi:molybdopterin/thiamine biosynthesis adenylyltransferase
MTKSKRLADVTIHVGGTGRIGAASIFALEALGFRHFTFNDRQLVEAEQLHSWNFSRRSDLGRPKVHVIEKFLDGRANLILEPVVAPNQAPEVEPYLEKADLIISCANDLDARLYLERAAIRLRKPCIQASAQDGREAIAGMISVWVPEADSSCFGCLIPHRPSVIRGELLVQTLTNTLANLAAQIASELLCGNAKEFVQKHNLFAVDLDNFNVERFSIKPRPDCAICGTGKRGPTT